LEGYRRLAFMMLDADIVPVSPSSVYHVLKAADKLAPRSGAHARKGKGFVQPLRPLEHLHVEVSYFTGGPSSSCAASLTATFLIGGSTVR
jgi:hypothetical protein